MSGKTWPPAFTKYPSIENHTNASRIAAFRRNGKTDICDWIICEKIHGANLSFTTNGTNLLCSRRTGLLQPEEKFYNFQAIQEKYRDSVMKCWELARNFEMIESDDTITIYGELFGGIYRHPSVSHPVERVIPVQKEVQYCPHTDFLAFDLRCGADDYVDMEAMWSMFDEAGVPYISPLKTGCSFKEAIAFDPKFHTTVPALFGLPEIKNNFAEGVVIRPIKSLMSNGHRVIVKIKTEDFNERGKAARKQIKEDDQKMACPCTRFDAVFEQLRIYLNDNRLVSLLSKEGELTRENRGEMIKCLVEDAVDEYRRDEDLREIFDGLTDLEQEIVKKKLDGMAMKVMKNHQAEEK